MALTRITTSPGRFCIQQRLYRPIRRIFTAALISRFGNRVLLMFAGNETTTNLISNEMLALLQNLGQLWLLQGNPGLIGPATEGLSRYDSPVQETARMANVNIEIGGKVIKVGELVMLCYTSANRDPK